MAQKMDTKRMGQRPPRGKRGKAQNRQHGTPGRGQERNEEDSGVHLKSIPAQLQRERLPWTVQATAVTRKVERIIWEKVGGGGVRQIHLSK